MIDKDSEYPDATSARASRQEEEKEFLRLFNSQQFRPRTAILTVLYEYPNDLFFQSMPAKDKISSSIPDKDEYGNVSEIKKNNALIYEVYQKSSQDWGHKQFIAKNLYKLQVFSFESNALSHSVLPCLHAFLEGFFQDTLQFHRHSLLDGFHIWKMDSLNDLLELGGQKKSQGARSGEQGG